MLPSPKKPSSRSIKIQPKLHVHLRNFCVVYLLQIGLLQKNQNKPFSNPQFLNCCKSSQTPKSSNQNQAICFVLSA